MKYLGIDPGTATTGFGVITKVKNKISVVEYGVVLTPKHEPPAKRLEIIYDDITEIIKTHKPDYACVEKLFFTTNQKTAMEVSQSRGIILLALTKAKVQLHELTPLQVKNYLTGYGKADKKQMQKMIAMSLGLATVPKPDDAADALALAYCLSFIKQ